MKRCIFIVEDRLTDIAGCMLTLQTILNAGLKNRPEHEWQDIYLYFLHICGDEKPQEEYESRFKNAFRHSEEVMETYKLHSFGGVDYDAIQLKPDIYASNKIDALVNEIIQKQRAYLKKRNFEQEFIQSFPDVSNNNDAYVLLLDIILAQKDNEDQERIQNCQPILSSKLYSEFPKGCCITYTNYSEYYGDKWVALAEVTDKEVPIERERLTRARAIYTPLKTRLYKALGIQM